MVGLTAQRGAADKETHAPANTTNRLTFPAARSPKVVGTWVTTMLAVVLHH